VTEAPKAEATSPVVTEVSKAEDEVAQEAAHEAYQRHLPKLRRIFNEVAANAASRKVGEEDGNEEEAGATDGLEDPSPGMAEKSCLSPLLF
jgi:hypothetical protein